MDNQDNGKRFYIKIILISATLILNYWCPVKEYQELVDMKLQYMRQRLQVLRETPL